MFKYLKIGASALALSAFVLAPATLVITADASYAKSENAGGKGNGGGNGGGNKGGDGSKGSGGSKGGEAKGKGANKGQGKARGKSASRGSFKSDMKALGRNLKSGFGIFGGNKTKAASGKTVRSTPKKPTKSVNAPTRSLKPPKMPDRIQTARAISKGTLHPSNLGKLNGALNSSPNAKAAHIANGNFNGPVGVAAALALADYNFEQENADFTAAEETVALANALAEAQELVDNAPTEAEIAAATETLADPNATQEEIDAANETLSYPDTTAAENLLADTTPPDAQTLAEAQAVVDAGPPSQEAVIAAEDAVLDAYKGPLTEEDESAVLDAVRAANPTEEEIAAALEKRGSTVDDTEEANASDGTDNAVAGDTLPEKS